jgi:hypothetical protein
MSQLGVRERARGRVRNYAFDNWVSTAGTGVPWLHVRRDTRPKYDRHAPYRAASRRG